MNFQQHSTATAGRRLMPAGEFKRVMGGISEMTRWRHEKAGIGPAPVKRNGRNYYFQDEVLAYLEALAASRRKPSDATSDDAAEDEMSDAASGNAAEDEDSCLPDDEKSWLAKRLVDP
jgi:hypothetical protein